MYPHVLTLLRRDGTGIPIVSRGALRAVSPKPGRPRLLGASMVWTVLSILLVAVAVAWARIAWLYAASRLERRQETRPTIQRLHPGRTEVGPSTPFSNQA